MLSSRAPRAWWCALSTIALSAREMAADTHAAQPPSKRHRPSQTAETRGVSVRQHVLHSSRCGGVVGVGGLTRAAGE